MTQHEMNTQRNLGHAQVGVLPGEHVRQDTPVDQVRMSPAEAAKQGTEPVARQTRKHGVKIASMNIKGKAMEGGKSKYPLLTQTIRKEKVVIIGLQETKLRKEDAINIRDKNPKIILLENINKAKPSAGGTAFMLNKDKIKNKKWNHEILIEGRAQWIRLEWNEQIEISIINIYMPNNWKEAVQMIDELTDIIKQKKIKNTIIMGDFNLTEDPIDRLPMNNDPEYVLRHFRELRNTLNVEDGWRITNWNEKEYTLAHKSSKSLSRIDRIYTPKENPENYADWTIDSNLGLSDHKMVTVTRIFPKDPEVGEGLWRAYEDTFNLEPIRMKMKHLLKETEIEMTEAKEIPGLPQKIWKDLKNKIKNTYEDEKKKLKRKDQKEENKIRKAIRIHKKQLIEDYEIEDWEKSQYSADNSNRKERRKIKRLIKLEEKLGKIKKEQAMKMKRKAKARFALDGEKGTKYWFNLNKIRKDKEPIRELTDKQGRNTEKIKEMLEIANEYHQNLQKKPEMSRERKKAIKNITKKMTRKLNEEQATEMNEPFTEQEIAQSLKESSNGKAPGTDGIPYEFYKSWPQPEPDDKENPDICKMLNILYQDIRKGGITSTDFTKGAMALLYKKGEKNKIENYRPVTLLNADYKVLTKMLSKRLGKIAKDLIHEDQTGFVPGRSIYDATRLTKMLLTYTEMKNIKGSIIALDQEKAYDKIDHDYLWIVLKKNNFPEEIIKIISELYKGATTDILVNGHRSQPYKVERGVRQGDPMSCLLYDLAIEPLAESLRGSKLEGIRTSNGKRTIASLFADDTMVFLNENDRVEDLNIILDEFCLASTARFNEKKTEFLPFGPKEYRAQVLEQRKLNENSTYSIPANTKIIQNGEAMRTLGCWVGYDINLHPQWNAIIEKQKKILEMWGATRPSTKGKELILKALIISLGQYLMTVNNLPNNKEKEIRKLTSDFIWDYKKPLISWKKTISPREKGGLGMPDIRSRLEAIELTWLKRYLEPEETRPRWAEIADEIIKEKIPEKPIKVQEINRKSWIFQHWNEKESTLPADLDRMFRTARKHNLTIETKRLQKETKETLPIMHHIGIENQYHWNKKAAICLATNHGVGTVRDLQEIAEGYETHDCGHRTRCINIAEKIAGNLPERFNPLVTPLKDNLDHTPNRLRKYKEKPNKKPRKTWVFNPDIRDAHKTDAIRILGTTKGSKARRFFPPEFFEPIARRDTPQEGTRKIFIIIKKQKEKGKTKHKNTWMRNTRLAKKAPKYQLTLKWEENRQKKRIHRILPENSTREERTLMGILEALEQGRRKRLNIHMKDLITIRKVCLKSKELEDLNWMEIQNKELWKKTVNNLRKYGSTIKFTKMNKEIEKELAKTIDKGPKRPWKTDKEDNSHIKDGARLMALNQKNIYRLLINKIEEDTPQTEERIFQKIKQSLQEWTTPPQNREELWKKLWKDDIIDNKIKDFIWRAINNRVKCGQYFKNIPGWEDKATCKCGVLETLEHIIMKCPHNHSKEIWDLARTTWREITTRPNQWHQPNLFDILGITAAEFTFKGNLCKNEQRTQKELTTVIKLIWTQTMWFIWKTRNHRVIAEKKIHKEQMKKEYLEAIKERVWLEWNKIKAERETRKIRTLRDEEEKLTRVSRKEEELAKTWAPNREDVTERHQATYYDYQKKEFQFTFRKTLEMLRKCKRKRSNNEEDGPEKNRKIRKLALDEEETVYERRPRTRTKRKPRSGT